MVTGNRMAPNLNVKSYQYPASGGWLLSPSTPNEKGAVFKTNRHFVIFGSNFNWCFPTIGYMFLAVLVSNFAIKEAAPSGPEVSVKCNLIAKSRHSKRIPAENNKSAINWDYSAPAIGVSLIFVF